MDQEDTIIYDEDDNGYPWMGAIIAIGVSAIVIFCFIIPWLVGWVNILKWIF